MYKPLANLVRDGALIDGAAHPLFIDASTEVFVFSDETALAIESLVRSKTFALPQPDTLRLPYKNMVVELPLTEDVQRLRGDAETAGAQPIARVAAIIRETGEGEDRLISFTPFWQYAMGQIGMSVATFIVGTHLPEMLSQYRLQLMAAENHASSTVVAFIPSPTVVHMMQTSGVPPEAAVGMFDTLVTQAPHMITQGASEIAALLFASSLLLTCRSGVSTYAVPVVVASGCSYPGKLGQRKRAERSRDRFTRVYLTALEQVDADGSVQPASDRQAHYVRGHFKQRASGVFWWNPFVRGSGELRNRAAYIVTGAKNDHTVLS